MKCILHDFRRAITGRWFLVALLASTAALYLSIGDATNRLMNVLSNYDLMNVLSSYESYVDMGFPLNIADFLRDGLAGDFGIMTLPALSALPFAAQPLTELKCGALRPAIFRTGRTSWIIGKAWACILCGMLLHAAAVLLLTLALQGVTLGTIGRLIPMGDASGMPMLLFRRMLCGGIWAGVGCLIALLTETASAAYLAPLCVCYAMVMIGTRFFPEIPQLNPANWLNGLTWPLLLGMAAIAAGLMLILRREVAKHA